MGDTISPKQIQNGGHQSISKILHIENQRVCGIETYTHLKYEQV